MTTHYQHLSDAVRALRRLPDNGGDESVIAYVYPNRDDVDEGHDYLGFAVVDAQAIGDWNGQYYYTAVDPGEVWEAVEDSLAGDADELHDRRKDDRLTREHE